MTHKVTITAGIRTETLYHGPSARYAGLVYQSAIETLRFTDATGTVQDSTLSRGVPTCIATTPVEQGKSQGQSVRYPGRRDSLLGGNAEVK